MIESLRRRLRTARRRAVALERRRSDDARHWLAETSNLTHASVLVFVPLLIGFVTLLSNELQLVSFLLFPPLASGTYTLFAHPEGTYANPWKFVGGLSLGAFCGWVAIEFTALLVAPTGGGAVLWEVHAWAAALAIFLTGALTWVFDLEEPSAFSTALLVLLTDPGRFLDVAGIAVSTSVVYVVTVALSTSIIAVVFVVWRHEFYERRARYLYSTTQADDHVLVPVHDDVGAQAAMFGARLAAAHDAGKVVLLDVVDDAAIAAAERRLLDEAGDVDLGTGNPDVGDDADIHELAERSAADEAAAELERRAAHIETRVGVPCEVVVAVESDLSAAGLLDVARDANCDLIAPPLEREANGTPARLVRDLFRSDVDTVAFDAKHDRTDWKRVMVPVRRTGPIAHAMVDYAERLAGRAGTVSVCTCIGDERSRRDAESMLADLTETTNARCETRVSRATLGEFLARNESHYDLVILGEPTRSARPDTPAPFERSRDLDTDVAVVHTR
ncbi:HPP family protein [Halarchaeum nitratireducens]|uniref:Universal stress protein UspA n=1 Tax=Halarchaeum nitratireducens TaxID=489913 RepID=A0A830G722_9EURY|nr:HPP family protein [Halarchaeum nitratireducens]GGN07397.1 universal stress protein UspA [Halarchaeum nitratireducens]